MFSLHETTRKRTCRTAFFALCLAPTCATAAWIADHHLPWRDAAAARRLSDRYHLDVTLADWQDPRPNTTRIAGVTLAEPSAANPLLQLTGVETHRRGNALILTVNELSLAVADLPALAARLEWSLTRTAAEKIELHVNKLTLQQAAIAGRGPHADQAPSVTFHHLHGVIERDQHDQPRLRLIAHLTAQPTPDAKPIALAVEPVSASASAEAARGEANGEQKTVAAPRGHVITLNTQQHAIPVAILAPLVPGMASLNDAATFAGVVTWRADDARLAGSIQGRLDGVNLAGILPENSPHILTGSAVVELTDCHWQGDQFQRLAGTLTSTDAAANGSLLIAVRAYLGSKFDDAYKDLQAAAVRAIARQPATAEDIAAAAEIHEFSHLACRFTLDAAGLAIEPRIPAASTLPAGTLAAIADRPALFCPQLADAAKLPAVAWLQFIASPTGPYWMPVTPATLEIARRLPAPQ